MAVVGRPRWGLTLEEKDVSSEVLEGELASVPVQPKRYSPVFLSVFTVFLLATTLCAVGTVLGVILAGLTSHDTLCYWVSGHLLVHGHNPYERAAFSSIETSLGFHVNPKDVFMTRNPPVALFLMAPLGLLWPKAGVIVWGLFLVGCLLGSLWMLKGMLQGPYKRHVIGLAWCFTPALACTETGQTGLIVLLALTLFLLLQVRRPFWAGVALSLCAVKPHLLLPFGVVFLVWVAVRRKWLALAGVVVAGIIEGAFPLLLDRAVWPHYLEAIRTEHIVDEFVPTLGTALRFLVDRELMWLQFIPAMLACAWALWYFWRNRERWDWRTHGSLLTLVSLAVAPYSWFTDSAIALPAILFALMGRNPPRRGSLTLLLALMSAAAIEMMTTSMFYFKPNLALGAAWLVWYLYATSGKAPSQTAEVASTGGMDAVSA